jgi:hypothetical protein
MQMRSTRPLGQIALVLITGFTVAACVATTGLIAGSAAPSAAPSVATPSTLPLASARPAVAVASAAPSVAAPTNNPSDPAPDPGTVGPGCGTGQAGLDAHRDEIPADLQFGGAGYAFTTASLSLRNGTIDTGDSIPGGIGLTANEMAVVVSPGAHIILRGTGLRLTEATIGVVPWSMVSFEGGLPSFQGPRTGLAMRLRADGSISVSAPAEPGDYAVEFVPRWTSECLEGDGTAYGRIKVR